MSDPTPDEDCSLVLQRLAAFLDGECTDTDADEIRAHLEYCDTCVEDADVALALKALVKRCCAPQPCPEGLRSRIVTTYTVRTVTWTQEL